MSYTKSYIINLFWEGVFTQAYVTGGNKRAAIRKFILNVKPEWLDDLSELKKTQDGGYKLSLRSPTGVKMDATFNIRQIYTGSDFIMLSMSNMHDHYTSTD
ncbi:MAG: hypothetical protein IKU29_00770 [Parabacteroides sp.]|nr:hypothetical protein [Parabacteroides sp.]